MSPDEVVRALAAGNTVSPSGNIRIGDLWPMVAVNSAVGNIKDLSNIPIRSQGMQTIFIRDVGSVEDGADIQTGYALVGGHRTVYIPVNNEQTPRHLRSSKPSKPTCRASSRSCPTTSRSVT
jgi:multidrug efflux pump subunit AcrB